MAAATRLKGFHAVNGRAPIRTTGRASSVDMETSERLPVSCRPSGERLEPAAAGLEILPPYLFRHYPSVFSASSLFPKLHPEPFGCDLLRAIGQTSGRSFVGSVALRYTPPSFPPGCIYFV